MKDGNDGKNETHTSHPSHTSHSSHPVIPPRGDYQTLLSFQKAEVIYDITFRFAHRFLPKGDRTIDQMVQAARSGKKNILLRITVSLSRPARRPSSPILRFA